MKIRTTNIVATTLLIVGWCQVGFAQPLTDQRAALVDLASLRVDVQLIGAAGSIGFTEPSLSQTVETQLRRAGLEVRGPDDQVPRGDPHLRVAIQAVDAAGGYAFLVSVQLVERVITYRRYVALVFDGVLPTAPTDSVEPLEIATGIKWEAQALGTTSRANAVNSIPNALVGYVDRFLEDYRAANPG